MGLASLGLSRRVGLGSHLGVVAEEVLKVGDQEKAVF